MKITKNEVLNVLDGIYAMIDNLDFVGCLIDDEYTEFVESLNFISNYIKQQEDK